MTDQTKFTLDEVFDVEPRNSDWHLTVSEPQAPVPALLGTDVEKLDSAETKAITTITSMIGKSQDAIESMMEIAQATEKSRDFEVLSNMIKATSDMSLQLVETLERVDRIKNKGKGQQPTGNTTVNQAVFVGSTKEMSSLLAARRGNSNE